MNSDQLKPFTDGNGPDISTSKENAPSPLELVIEDVDYGQFIYEPSEDLESQESEPVRDVTFSSGVNKKTSFHRKLTFIRSNSGINRYLSRVSDHPERDTTLERQDEERLYRAMEDAGRHALGIVAISAWVMDEKTGMLKRPPGAWWRDPSFVPNDIIALARIEDPSRTDYLPPVPAIAGVGLEGDRFVNGRDQSQVSIRSFRRAHSSGSGLYSFGDNDKPHWARKHMIWRDLQTLLEDPDTAKGPRLECLVRAGLGKASAVNLEISGHKIMVIYFARRHTSESILTSIENQECLHRSANVISYIIASSHARKACEVSRLLLRRNAKQKFIYNLLTHKASINGTKAQTNMLTPLPEIKSTSLMENEMWIHNFQNFKCRLQRYVHKFLGGDLQSPPALSWSQCFVTLVGCFFGLLVLSAFNEFAIKLSDRNYELLIGPFGKCVVVLNCCIT